MLDTNDTYFMTKPDIQVRLKSDRAAFGDCVIRDLGRLGSESDIDWYRYGGYWRSNTTKNTSSSTVGDSGASEGKIWDDDDFERCMTEFDECCKSPAEGQEE